MSELYQQIEQAANFISKIEAIPDHAIILGTGLGTLLDRIEIIKEISFKVIPYFLPTTVESHVGKLILAKWNGKLILILSDAYIIMKVILHKKLLFQFGY